MDIFGGIHSTEIIIAAQISNAKKHNKTCRAHPVSWMKYIFRETMAGRLLKRGGKRVFGAATSKVTTLLLNEYEI